MLVAVLAGLSLFGLLILVAVQLEERQEGLRLQLERLRSTKKEVSFSVGGLFGIEGVVSGLKERLVGAGVVSDPEDLLLWFVLGTVFAAAIAVYYDFVLLALLMPVGALSLGKYLLAAETSRRTRLLETQFKDFLVALNLQLAIVPAFQPSFMRATLVTANPLRSYLDRVVIGMQSGEATEEAIAVLRQIPSGQIAAWVDSVIFAVRVKANLAAMCKRAAERLVLKSKLAKRVEAQAMQSKSLMVSIAGLTLFMMVSTLISSPVFVEFYASSIGRVAATGGILSFVVTTFYVLRRIDVEMAK